MARCRGEVGTFPTLNLVDIYPGVQMGGQYVYRLTAIQGGASGSLALDWQAPWGSFQSSPLATVNGNTVSITPGVSYCYPAGVRCDPVILEFTVLSSSTGFSYSVQQPWFDNSDPSVPGSEPGTFRFGIPGVPSGTHTFNVTAWYQPNLQVPAGSVTVVVP